MFFRWCAAAASTRPRPRSISITATFHFEPRLENSLLPPWPSARASRSGLRTLRCRSAPAWLRRSGGGSNSPANACVCWPRWVPRPDWRLRSTRRSRRFCSSSKRSSDAGARAFLARWCCRRFRAWWWCAGFWGRSRCFASPPSAWCVPPSCWPTRCWESSEDWRRSSLPRPSATSGRGCEPGRAGRSTCNRPMAGLIIGLIGFLGAPQVMGAGYEYMDQAMHDQFTWKMLAILALLKIVATTLSFVSGTPGGMFAPTLFVGAMLGGAVGGVGTRLVSWPHRIHRHLCAGRHGCAVRGIPARADDVGVHGAGSERQLFHHRARHRGEHAGLRHLPWAASRPRSSICSPARMASTCPRLRSNGSRPSCGWKMP